MIDLPKEKLDELGISTMSCFVNMGGKSYEDLIDITPEDVFKHLDKTGEIAKTAAKSEDHYFEFFEPFAGKDTAIIHFATSSGISLLCENAIRAAKRLPNTYVIDTKALSNGIALLVGYAMDLIQKGEKDPAKIVAKVIAQRQKLQGSFLINTMECLYKGGRCSTLQYFAANLLRIKPVITMNPDDGKMIVREKCRGGRALTQYIENTFEKYPDPDLKDLYLIHFCKDPALVKFFVDTATSYYKFENVHMGEPGCNCTIHAGPNTFGMFYFVK